MRVLFGILAPAASEAAEHDDFTVKADQDGLKVV